MAEIKEFKIERSSPMAQKLIQDLQEWARDGKIAAIGVYVVFDDGTGYSDWMADQKVNVDVLAGGMSSVVYRIHNRTNE